MSKYPDITLDRACDILAQVERPAVVIHVRPDGDAVGSAVALIHMFRALGHAPVLCSSDPIPERLQFIFDGADISFCDGTAEYTAVAVDTATRERMGRPSDIFDESHPPVLMIDHHMTGEAYAPRYIDPDASATAELLYLLACRMVERGMIPAITTEMANAMFAAISSDTGCFKFDNASPRTHRIAADLISLGARAGYINRMLFDSKSAEQLKAESIVLSSMVLHPSGKVAYVVIPRETRLAAGLPEYEFETAVDIVRSLKGVEIAATLRESDPGVYRVSLRSTDADVSALAAVFGGGGHVHAAGCTLHAESAAQAVDALLGAVLPAISA